MIENCASLSGNIRYGYVAEPIIRDGAIPAVVTDTPAYGSRGYYPYAYMSDMNRRYELPHGASEIDTPGTSRTLCTNASNKKHMI